MVRVFLIALSLVATLAKFSAADPQSDAAYIVDARTPPQAAFDALHNVTLDSFDNIFAELGAKIIDRDTFKSAVFGDYFETLHIRIRDQAIEAYVAAMPPEDLALLADFYRARNQAPDDQSTGPENDPRADLKKYLPALDAYTVHLLTEFETEILSFFAPQRIADILEMPHLVSFEDDRQRTGWVAAMREAGS